MIKKDDLEYQIKNYLNIENIPDTDEILNLLKNKNTQKSKYLSGRLLFNLSMKTDKLEYIDKSISIFEEIKECDFDNINFYLGTLYLAKFTLKKPKYIGDSEKLLYNSKIHLKKEYVKNYNGNNRKTLVNLGIVYSNIGRTIESLDYFEKILKTHNSTHALYNKGYALYIYSYFLNGPNLIIRDVYNIFKKVISDDNFTPEMQKNAQKYLNEILEVYSKEFLETENENTFEIEYESEFEKFMIDYCLNNKLYLNLCNFCQKCENSIGDNIAPEKLNNKIFTSYINQLKMDYVSARFLLILSQYDDFNLDIISKYVFIDDIDFAEENNIHIQLLKDSFKNFFNILDKISYFLNQYLDLKIDSNNVGFRNIWFKNGEYKKGINKKLVKIQNAGLTALYDIYLDLEYENDMSYLRKTRNTLTHKYLRITNNKENENDKTFEELHDETIEIAILSKNAIIYLMRFINIYKE